MAQASSAPDRQKRRWFILKCSAVSFPLVEHLLAFGGADAVHDQSHNQVKPKPLISAYLLYSSAIQG
jgi:hypothetical protein